MSREMYHGPMGSRDGMVCGTHTHLREGQLDIPWNVLWSHGIMGWAVGYICMSERDNWTSQGMSHNPIWDRGMGWTFYGISGHLCDYLTICMQLEFYNHGNHV